MYGRRGVHTIGPNTPISGFASQGQKVILGMSKGVRPSCKRVTFFGAVYFSSVWSIDMEFGYVIKTQTTYQV